MDYFGIAKEAWRIGRRNRALWGFGALTAVQSLALGVLVALVAVPFALLIALQSMSAAEPRLLAVLERVSGYMIRLWPALIATLVIGCVIWIATGILDVAGQGGLITETIAAREGRRPTGFRVGLAHGFTHWWRIAGLYALMALPSLLYLLLLSVGMFTAVALPSLRGQVPDPLTVQRVLAGVSPFSGLASLAGIALTVLCTLALRWVVVDGLEVRASLGASWGLIKAQLSRVVLMWLTALLASAVVLYGGGTVVYLVGGALAVPVIAVGASNAGLGIALAAVLALAVLAALTAVVAIQTAWQSAMLTLFWGACTGRDVRFLETSADPTATQRGPEPLPQEGDPA